MSYDEWGQRHPPPRLLHGVAGLAVLSLAATGVSVYGFVRHSRVLDAERDARRAEVAELRREVRALEGSGAQLAGRLRSAETALERRETGIAPVAARVLRSVFTVRADDGSLGTGFVAWTEGGRATS